MPIWPGSNGSRGVVCEWHNVREMREWTEDAHKDENGTLMA
jgi:hypothetical protein